MISKIICCFNSRFLMQVACLFAFNLMFCSPSSSQDLIVQPHYRLSPDPNYKLTSGGDNKDLTDGIASTSLRFWRNTSTVGWTAAKKIVIDFELSAREQISKIEVNTVRGESSEVNFPLNGYVFLSKDNKNFWFYGDVFENRDNLPGPTKVQKFSLDRINGEAKYVKFVLIPNGKYLFIDEVTMYKADTDLQSNRNQSIHASVPIDLLNNYIDSLRHNSMDRRIKIKKINNLMLDERMDHSTTLFLNGNHESVNIDDLLEGLQKKKAVFLYNKFINEDFIIEKVNTWRTNFPLLPTHDVKSDRFEFFFERGLTQYGAFIVTNTSLNPSSYSISSSKHGISLDFYKLATVPTSNPLNLVDAILPLKNELLTLLPGESQAVFFEITGNHIGNFESEILVSNDLEVKKINVNTNVINRRNFDKMPLYANNWAYLDYPLIAERKHLAVNDLNNHHINTIVLHRSFIPSIGSTDFTSLREYLKWYSDTENSKILLYYNFESKGRRNVNNIEFMSNEWKSIFKNWYEKLVAELMLVGFKENNIYFYPYDELKPSDLDYYIQFATWSKRNVPWINLYLTISDKKSMTAIDYTDITQIHTNLIQEGSQYAKDNEIWLYEVIENSREQPPYNYRLQAWKAFYYGFKGIGFWNYSFLGNDISENDFRKPVVNSYSDNSVIYTETGGGLISSRRWEAFKLGIEDFYLLRQFEEKYGYEEAKKIAKRVVNKQNDPELADITRNLIISKIRN